MAALATQDAALADEKNQLEPILEKIREARNFDFRNYKRATLIRRIERRMADRRCGDWKEYSALLDREPGEFDALIASMLIKVTSFFRDEEVWSALSSRVIPAMISRKRNDEELRIWSAGCATGEEAYSIAIQLAEVLGPGYQDFNFKVFGTDVDEAAVAFARRGVYPAAQLQGVPAHILDRWFSHGPEGYAVRKEIRRAVVFGVNNLASDAPISRLDMVLCRNVFIYMDAQLQKRVLGRFHYALRNDGILVLGRSELIPFAGRVFEVDDLTHRIYRRDGHREVQPHFPERIAGLLDPVVTPPDASLILGTHLERAGVRDALDALATPIVVTSLDGAVTLWNQAATRLWNRAEAEVTGKKLSSLALPGFNTELTGSVTELVREGRIERDSADGTLNISSRQQISTINVEVSPQRNPGGAIIGIVYVVRDVTNARETEVELRRIRQELSEANDLHSGVNERLREANEELETTNEELQSANEELQTTNEELQSTNEELETTNEELQSANAELDATNRELAHRTEQMNLLALYQRTIIRSLSAAVVVVDPSGRITAWNLAAERLLGLPEAEAVGQTLWTLRVPALNKGAIGRIRRALESRRPVRMEDVTYALPSAGHGYASIAAVPLMDGDVMLGAVILFEDTTRAVSLNAENAKLKTRIAPRKSRKK